MRVRKSTILIILVFIAFGSAAFAEDDQRPVRSHPRNPYPNVVSVSPLPLSALEGATYFGAGIEYERFIGRKGRFSAHLPVFGGKIGLQPETGQLYTLAPGFRYHPMGNMRKLDFSFGPQFLFGWRNHEWHETQPEVWQNMTGILLQMNLDLHLKKHGLIGVYTAWGVYNEQQYGGLPGMARYYNSVNGMAILLGLRIGARF